MTVEISRVVLDNIIQDVQRDLLHERCGLLYGQNRQIILDFEPVANLHSQPRRFFELDSANLLAAVRREREGGLLFLGHYHSHPAGDAIPSREDANQATADGRFWLIVGKEDVRLWQSVANGALYNRFNPLNLKITL